MGIVCVVGVAPTQSPAQGVSARIGSRIVGCSYPISKRFHCFTCIKEEGSFTRERRTVLGAQVSIRKILPVFLSDAAFRSCINLHIGEFLQILVQKVELSKLNEIAALRLGYLILIISVLGYLWIDVGVDGPILVNTTM